LDFVLDEVKGGGQFYFSSNQNNKRGKGFSYLYTRKLAINQLVEYNASCNPTVNFSHSLKYPEKKKGKRQKEKQSDSA